MPPKSPRLPARPQGQTSRPGGQTRRPAASKTPPIDAAARREAQRQARLRQGRRSSLRTWLPIGFGLTVLVAALIGYGVYVATRSEPGTKTPDDGRDHFQSHVSIAQTSFKPYTTAPPSSGPHWDVWATKGIYQEKPDEQLVHSLEHGYVVIHHNCNETACPDLYNQLKVIYSKYDKKVILNYRPKTPARIALVAWTRLQTFEDVQLPRNSVNASILSDAQQSEIRTFIDAYYGNIGPEKDGP